MADNIKIVKALDVEVNVKPNEAQLNETKRKINEFIQKIQNDANVSVKVDLDKNQFKSLTDIANTVSKIYENMGKNMAKSMLDATNSVKKSIGELQEAGLRYISKTPKGNDNNSAKRVNAALRTPSIDVKDVDKQVNKIIKFYDSINKVKANPSSTWEQQYAAEVQFYKNFQAIQHKFSKKGIDLRKLFDDAGLFNTINETFENLSSTIEDKVAMLRNIAEFDPAKPQSFGYGHSGGEPWATEDTVLAIKDILEKGIKVSGFKSGGGGGSSGKQVDTAKIEAAKIAQDIFDIDKKLSDAAKQIRIDELNKPKNSQTILSRIKETIPDESKVFDSDEAEEKYYDDLDKVRQKIISSLTNKNTSKSDKEAIDELFNIDSLSKMTDEDIMKKVAELPERILNKILASIGVDLLKLPQSKEFSELLRTRTNKTEEFKKITGNAWNDNEVAKEQKKFIDNGGLKNAPPQPEKKEAPKTEEPKQTPPKSEDKQPGQMPKMSPEDLAQLTQSLSPIIEALSSIKQPSDELAAAITNLKTKFDELSGSIKTDGSMTSGPAQSVEIDTQDLGAAIASALKGTPLDVNVTGGSTESTLSADAIRQLTEAISRTRPSTGDPILDDLYRQLAEAEAELEKSNTLKSDTDETSNKLLSERMSASESKRNGQTMHRETWFAGKGDNILTTRQGTYRAVQTGKLTSDMDMQGHIHPSNTWFSSEDIANQRKVKVEDKNANYNTEILKTLDQVVKITGLKGLSSAQMASFYDEMKNIEALGSERAALGDKTTFLMQNSLMDEVAKKYGLQYSVANNDGSDYALLSKQDLQLVKQLLKITSNYGGSEEDYAERHKVRNNIRKQSWYQEDVGYYKPSKTFAIGATQEVLDRNESEVYKLYDDIKREVENVVKYNGEENLTEYMQQLVAFFKENEGKSTTNLRNMIPQLKAWLGTSSDFTHDNDMDDFLKERGITGVDKPKSKSVLGWDTVKSDIDDNSSKSLLPNPDDFKRPGFSNKITDTQKAEVQKLMEEYSAIIDILQKGDQSDKDIVRALKERADAIKDVMKKLTGPDAILDWTLGDYGASPKVKRSFNTDLTGGHGSFDVNSDEIDDDSRQKAIDLIYKEIDAEKQLVAEKEAAARAEREAERLEDKQNFIDAYKNATEQERTLAKELYNLEQQRLQMWNNPDVEDGAYEKIARQTHNKRDELSDINPTLADAAKFAPSGMGVLEELSKIDKRNIANTSSDVADKKALVEEIRAKIAERYQELNGGDSSAPWAKDETLKGEIKTILTQIQTNTANGVTQITNAIIETIKTLVGVIQSGRELGAGLDNVDGIGKLVQSWSNTDKSLSYNDTREKLAYFNKNTGEIVSSGIATDVDGINRSTLNAIREYAGIRINEYGEVIQQAMLAEIHSHPVKSAVFSPEDIRAFKENLHHGISEYFVSSFNEVAQIDFSALFGDNSTDFDSTTYEKFAKDYNANVMLMDEMTQNQTFSAEEYQLELRKVLLETLKQYPQISYKTMSVSDFVSGHIGTNIGNQISTNSIVSTTDTGSVDASKENTQQGSWAKGDTIDAIKNAVESINRKIQQGTKVISTGTGAGSTTTPRAASAPQRGPKEPTKKQKDAANEKELLGLYKQLGALNVDKKNNPAEVKDIQAKIDAVKAEIDAKKQLIKVDDQLIIDAQKQGAEDQKAKYTKKDKTGVNKAKEEQKAIEDLLDAYSQLAKYKKERELAVLGGKPTDQADKRIADIRQRIKDIMGRDAYANMDSSRKYQVAKRVKAEGQSATQDAENKAKASEFKSLEAQYKKIGEWEARIAKMPAGTTEAAQKLVDEWKQIADAKRDALGIDPQLLANAQEQAKKTEQLKLEQKAADKEIQRQRQAAGLGSAKTVVGKSEYLSGELDALFNNGVDVDNNDAVIKFKASLEELSILYQRLDAQQGPIDPNDAKNLNTLRLQTEEYRKTVAKLVDELNLASNQTFDISGLGEKTLTGDVSTYKDELTKIANQITNGKAKIGEFDSATNTLNYTVQTGAREMSTFSLSVTDLGNRVVQTTGPVKRIETFMDTIKRKTKEVAAYFIGSGSIYKVFNEVRRGIGYVKEIDTALTELKKVTDETEETYDRFLQTASKTAGKVGSTIKDVVSSTADWARLGYSLQDAAQLAESTQILMNVSEFTDINQATDSLISSIQAFKYTAEESMDVVDILNTIGNNYAISTADLAKSLTKSSGSLVAANGTLEEAVALTATANTIIQDADVVGKQLADFKSGYNG